ncbi:hypothetical protein [Thermoproteus tenax]|uniref:hypothetical protein n=1 Tax=Thermoproteus tenax TaxID=2271 RepID=UPI00069B3C20|nr:hypothetical protein [Thermoproteus tenax]
MDGVRYVVTGFYILVSAIAMGYAAILFLGTGAAFDDIVDGGVKTEGGSVHAELPQKRVSLRVSRYPHRPD